MDADRARAEQRARSRGLLLFSSLQESFETALQSTEEQRRYFRIAEKIVCLRFAGPAMIAQCTRALSHLSCDPGPVDFEICCFDGASSGIRFPQELLDPEVRANSAGLQGFSDAFVSTQYQAGMNAFNLFNRQHLRAIHCVDDATRSGTTQQFASPFRYLFNVWVQKIDLVPVHAAAVGTQDAGILLVGRSGIGKTSSALSCVGELLLASEDFAAVDPAHARIYSYYHTAKLRPSEFQYFPKLRPHFISPNARSQAAAATEEKQVLFLQESFPESVTTSLPLSAVLVPCINEGEEYKISAISKAKALLHLAPTSLLHAANAGGQGFERLASILESAPCFEMRVGSDRSRIVGVIRSLLAELR